MRCRSLPHLRRHLAATVDLTLWCLGCDVRHPGGNLLVRRGFGRVRPPGGHVGGTMYTAPCAALGGPLGSGPSGNGPPGGPPHLVVWGFALFLGDAVRGAGLLLRRHDDAGARLTAAGALPAPLWTPDALPAGRTPGCAADAALLAALLRDAAGEVAAHERWVDAHCGPDYRPACAAGQPRHVRRRQRLGTAGLVAAWHAAADGYAALVAPPAVRARAVRAPAAAAPLLLDAAA